MHPGPRILHPGGCTYPASCGRSNSMLKRYAKKGLPVFSGMQKGFGKVPSATFLNHCGTGWQIIQIVSKHYRLYFDTLRAEQIKHGQFSFLITSKHPTEGAFFLHKNKNFLEICHIKNIKNITGGKYYDYNFFVTFRDWAFYFFNQAISRGSKHLTTPHE